jgi:4-amino-4-deoxy-L-arabinose transferase
MPASPRSKRSVLLVFALLAGLLVLSLGFQGSRGLWEPDEGRYTNVALEMVSLRDWLVPHLQYEHAHWTKPPLAYWAIAGSLELLGRNEFAARLTSALSFFATAVLLGLMGRIFLERRPWLPALVYAASLLPFLASNIVSTDSLLALWECLAVFAFARATWDPDCRHSFAWLMVMWGAFGLAFMTKGPPGLLPLMAIVVFTLTTPGLRQGQTLRAWPGTLLMLAIALPWYLLVILKKPDLLSYFISHEIIDRVASDQFNRSAEWYGAFRVYLPTLLLGMLPWTWWLLRMAWRGMKSRFQPGQAAATPPDARLRFLLWWLFLPLAVFFLARTRLPLYVLPACAPLALLASREVLKKPALPSRAGLLMLAAWMALLLVLRAAGGLVENTKDARAAAQALHDAGIGSCEEIAFYERKAMQGLRFYMDCEIEEVSGAELRDEMAEPEHRLWAVEGSNAAQFEQAMDNYAGQVDFVVEIPGLWRVYRETGPESDQPRP